MNGEKNHGRRAAAAGVWILCCLGATTATAAPPADKAAAPVKVTGGTPAVDPKALPGELEFNRCTKMPPGRRIKVTLKPRTSLADLVAWISSMTCKRFIIGASLRSQQVTLLSPTAITAREAYRAFVSALEVMGLTVVRSGTYLKVVQSNWAIQSAIPTYRHGQRRRLPMTEEVVTQLLQVTDASAAQLVPLLQKLKSRAGHVTSYAPSNALIITDSAINVRRMVRIVEQLDVPLGRSEIWVVQPEHASAADVSKVLKELFSARGAARTPGGRRGKASTPPSASGADARILSDPGSNALIIVASRPVFRRIRAVLKAIDVESSSSRARAWVYRLKHENAKKLAGVLGTLGKAGVARRGKASAQASLFEGPVQISAVDSSNSLVIMASTRDYINLRRVIRDLDRPRRQVFVEAYIMEITLNAERDIGVAYHGATNSGSNTMFGGLTHGTDFNSVAVDPLSMMGLALGIQGPVLPGSEKILGKEISAFGIAFQALQRNSDINVLSTPHLLTTDNEEAEILVGENIPLRSGTTSAPTAGADQQQQMLFSAMVQPVEYKKVGLSLKLKPTIGEGDSIRLELLQKAENVLKEDFGGLGASMATRSIQSVVTVRDRQTVVIGGLIREQQITTQSKVPVLGDLPIIGRLFRRDGTKRIKTNMMVVLTPYIIREQSDLRRIFSQKLKERQEFIRRFTSYKRRHQLSEVDFRYKRGLLGEIEHQARKVDLEVRRAAAADKERRRKGWQVRVGEQARSPADQDAVKREASAAP